MVLSLFSRNKGTAFPYLAGRARESDIKGTAFPYFPKNKLSCAVIDSAMVLVPDSKDSGATDGRVLHTFPLQSTTIVPQNTTPLLLSLSLFCS